MRSVFSGTRRVLAVCLVAGFLVTGVASAKVRTPDELANAPSQRQLWRGELRLADVLFVIRVMSGLSIPGG